MASDQRRSSQGGRKVKIGHPDISPRGMLTSPNVEEGLVLRLNKTGMTDEEFRQFWNETKARRAKHRELQRNAEVTSYTTEWTRVIRENNRVEPPKYFGYKMPKWRLPPIKRPPWDNRFCWTPYCDEFGNYHGTG